MKGLPVYPHARTVMSASWDHRANFNVMFQGTAEAQMDIAQTKVVSVWQITVGMNAFIVPRE